MPLLETKGAGSAQGFGLTLQQAAPVYIEDVMSTWLYTGNGSTQTITNGIDLAGKGGLVWIKSRSAARNNTLLDSARGASGGYYKPLFSNLTNAENTGPSYGVTSFNSSGFSLGDSPSAQELTNFNNETYASWTFRKQPKFFDVVTFTSAASGNTTFNHSLGSTPGFVIIKNTQRADSWYCYHRSLGNNFFIYLNLTNAQDPLTNAWAVSSTQVTINSAVMYASESYVAYVFAHNAGGFGLTGTDNVISCGSYTGTGAAGNTITLGYEPQWVLIKRTDAASSWNLADTMRGMPADGYNNRVLYPNLSSAENGLTGIGPTATGFTITSTDSDYNGGGASYIYIAIRRGPMKTPTSGTSVYEGTAYTGNGASNRQIGSSVLTDLLLLDNRDATAQSWSTYAQMFFDRLRGDSVSLATANTNAESGGWNSYIDFDMNAGWDTGPTTQQTYLNKTSSTYVSHAFSRAPGFFDVVCYTGNDVSARAVNHNLGVAPELVIVKARNDAANWPVYASALGNDKTLYLNLTNASATSGIWGNTTATSSYFYVGVAGDYGINNATGLNYVAYLFASCPGVSKCGSYTGNGSSQTINMGFTGGARFFLVKRTDSTGDWWLYDTARGMSGLNDPALRLNSSAAETTSSSDAVSTTSVGLIVNQESTCNINVNGATYIYLGIA